MPLVRSDKDLFLGGLLPWFWAYMFIIMPFSELMACAWHFYSQDRHPFQLVDSLKPSCASLSAKAIIEMDSFQLLRTYTSVQASSEWHVRDAQGCWRIDRSELLKWVPPLPMAILTTVLPSSFNLATIIDVLSNNGLSEVFGRNRENGLMRFVMFTIPDCVSILIIVSLTVQKRPAVFEGNDDLELVPTQDIPITSRQSEKSLTSWWKFPPTSCTRTTGAICLYLAINQVSEC